MELIDKSVIVAEIKRLIYIANSQYDLVCDEDIRNRILWSQQASVCSQILSFIDTLELKEVDLDESARHYLLHEHISPLNEVLHQADLKVEMQYHKDIEEAYKAGFELGLKTKKEE